MGSIAMRVKRKYCLLNNRFGLAKVLLFGPQKNAFEIQLSSNERLGPQARGPGHMHRDWPLLSSPFPSCHHMLYMAAWSTEYLKDMGRARAAAT